MIATNGNLTSGYAATSTANLADTIGAAAAGQINFALAGSTVQAWDVQYTGVLTGTNTVVFHYDPTLIGTTPESECALNTSSMVHGSCRGRTNHRRDGAHDHVPDRQLLAIRALAGARAVELVLFALRRSLPLADGGRDETTRVRGERIELQDAVADRYWLRTTDYRVLGLSAVRRPPEEPWRLTTAMYF